MMVFTPFPYTSTFPGAFDNIIVVRDVLSFSVVDSGSMRKEYTGPWLGAVRPRLSWRTREIE